MSSNYYQEYPFAPQGFSPLDLEAIETLKEVGKKVGLIFDKSESILLPGVNFYPVDISKEELIEASKANPLILNPYTIVKRDDKGNLFAIPYHEEYATELSEISDLLKKAALKIQNNDLKNYVVVAATELLVGNYEEMLKAWLAIGENSLIHLIVGPFSSYADQLLRVKRGYKFALTYKNTDNLYNPADYIEIAKSMSPPFGSKAKLKLPQEKIKVRIDNVIALAGRTSVFAPRAVNYPKDNELIEKYGIMVVIYTDSIKQRDKDVLVPLLRDILDKSVGSGFSDEIFISNAVKLVIAQEINKSLFQYQNSRQRLKETYAHLQEFHSCVVALKGMGFQVIKGALSEKDLEAVLYMVLMITFAGRALRAKYPSVEGYLTGFRVFFNYCLENGAIVYQEDSILPNSGKMYMCADQLSSIAMHLFSQGTDKEVKEFFNRYGSEFMYERFSDKLAKYSL